MKHVLATTNGGGDEKPVNSYDFPITSKLATSSTKSKFHDQTPVLFSKMVDNSANMLQTFQPMTSLLKQVDHQMDQLTKKL